MLRVLRFMHVKEKEKKKKYPQGKVLVEDRGGTDTKPRQEE
jgi:hypothetical protein